VSRPSKLRHFGSILAVSLVLAVGLAACDAGIFRVDPATLPTEPLVVLGANVGTNKPLPANGAIHLAFNRYLLPSTITRQAVTIAPVGGLPLEPPIVTYDPVARTVTIQNPVEDSPKPWLVEGQSYQVTVKVPSEADRNGLLALDGATLAEPTSFQFLVGPPGEAFKEPPVGLCEHVLPILAAKCAGNFCHSGGGATAASSLVVDTSVGLRNTALRRAAQGSTTGGTTEPLRPGRVFGINMPLVDPGSPGNSWLLYKILLAPLPKPGTPLSYTCTPPVPPVVYTPNGPYSEAPTDLETSVLQDYVPGREMPYPLAGPLPLTFNERELVRMWIAQGAKAPDCQGCRSITPEERDGGAAPPDAGGSDAGGSDAGGSDAGSDASGPDASADAGSD